MQEMIEKVDRLVNENIPTRPSYFQLQHFMLGKEPTHQAKLKRLIEELRGRKRDMDAARDEIAECLDRRRLLELGHAKELTLEPNDSKEVGEIKNRMLERRAGAIDRQVFDMRQVVASKVEEMAFLCDAYERLCEEQPLQPWDDPAVQLEYWEAKLRSEILLRMKLKMPQDLETIKTALNLPQGSGLKRELLDLMNPTAQLPGNESDKFCDTSNRGE